MYYARIESNAKANAAHQVTLKANARYRLDTNKQGKHVRQEDCAPNRKAAKRLAARQGDYALMVAQTSFKAPYGAYHKPGSAK